MTTPATIIETLRIGSRWDACPERQNAALDRLAAIMDRRTDMRADRPEPPPDGGRGDVTEDVIRDIRARSAMGVRKYGTPLRYQNGRQALMDAYQEALDLACYLRQEIGERRMAVSDLEGLGRRVSA